MPSKVWRNVWKARPALLKSFGGDAVKRRGGKLVSSIRENFSLSNYGQHPLRLSPCQFIYPRRFYLPRLSPLPPKEIDPRPCLPIRVNLHRFVRVSRFILIRFEIAELKIRLIFRIIFADKSHCRWLTKPDDRNIVIDALYCYDSRSAPIRSFH